MTKKTLCLGNEYQDTDDLTSIMARSHESVNHGLITDAMFVPQMPGFYHTSVADIDASGVMRLAAKFDQVIMLDQSSDSYGHFKSFITTFKVMCELETAGIDTQFRDNQHNKNIQYWYTLLRTNRSFCAYPFASWIENHDQTSLCCKNPLFIKPSKDILDWQTDPDYKKIRDRMIEGRQDWFQCGSACYSREEEGIESTRQFETLETAIRLDMKSMADFQALKRPVDYEIRPSNKCNIMCRMCDSDHSHLIEREWKQIGINLITSKPFKNTPLDAIDLATTKRIYVGGGEPTIMPEFYDFLQKCVDYGRTDFELLIGTNGMKISNKLLRLLENFPDVCFSVSFDGYKKINDYIRWKSEFDVIKENAKLLKNSGHKIGFQTVLSIYNTCRIHEIFEFYDSEFPGCSTLSQPAGFPGDILFPYNFPYADPVLESMHRCTKTNVYQANGRSTKTIIDAMIKIYSDPDYHCDIVKLRKFFEFNDKLDHARGSKLGDYIPELENCRDLIS